MFEHPQLAALRAILETGSFDAAASAIGVTPSAISQRIKGLERQVGGPVLRRGTPLVATTLGARLMAHAQDVALLGADLARDLGAPTTLRLPIAVNADSLATWFLPALAGHGDLRFDVKIVDQDHSAELLASGEATAIVTTRADPIAGADCRPLGILRYIPTATPEFAATHFAEGLSYEALSSAPALVFSDKDALQSDWAAARAGRKVVLPAHRLPSTRGFVDAACLGMGWGLNPLPLVKDHLDTGRLVDLSPETPHDVTLYWQSSRLGASVLEPLTKSVRSAARKALLPIDPA